MKPKIQVNDQPSFQLEVLNLIFLLNIITSMYLYLERQKMGEDKEETCFDYYLSFPIKVFIY